MIEIIHGECLAYLETHKEALLGKNITMAYLDLPFGYTEAKFDTRVDEKALFSLLFAILQNGSPIVAHASGKYANELGFVFAKHFYEALYWDKCFAANFVQAKRQHLKIVEPLLIFTKDGKAPHYYPQMTPREKPIYSGGQTKQSQTIPIRGKKATQWEKKTYHDRFPTNLLRYNVRAERGSHPTQKPIALLQYLIRTYSQEGDMIIDPCMGSGSMGLACAMERRGFVGIEKDDGYFREAQKRLFGRDS